MFVCMHACMCACMYVCMFIRLTLSVTWTVFRYSPILYGYFPNFFLLSGRFAVDAHNTYAEQLSIHRKSQEDILQLLSALDLYALLKKAEDSMGRRQDPAKVPEYSKYQVLQYQVLQYLPQVTYLLL